MIQRLQARLTRKRCRFARRGRGTDRYMRREKERERELCTRAHDPFPFRASPFYGSYDGVPHFSGKWESIWRMSLRNYSWQHALCSSPSYRVVPLMSCCSHGPSSPPLPTGSLLHLIHSSRYSAPRYPWKQCEFTAIFSSSSFYDTGSFGKFDLEYLDYCVKADIKLYYRMKGGVKLIWRGNNFKIVSEVC